jgi:hypothetical protein
MQPVASGLVYNNCMKSKSLFVALAMIVSACASSAPPTRPNEREWSALAAQYDAIEQIRKAAPNYLEKPTRREQIEVFLETNKKVESLHAPFMARLQEYAERTDDERAVRLFSNEKVRMGDVYMSVLARYDNAVTMYQTALAIDPANPVAQERLAAAQARRFVSMESFSQIKQGMSEAQVRAVLGQPREDWIKQVVQRTRVYSVWIYPKQDGGASAVYFDAGVVYHTNWNAAPSKSETR